MYDKLYMIIIHVVLTIVLTAAIVIVFCQNDTALTKWLVSIPLIVANILTIIGVIYQIKKR